MNIDCTTIVYGHNIIDPQLISSFNEAWKTESADITSSDASDMEQFGDASRDYLRVELTKKIVHARSGDLLKRYTEIFKSQLTTLLDFRAALKATAAPRASAAKKIVGAGAGAGAGAETTTGGDADKH